MSYLLTEKKNYQNILEKRQKINEIKNNELNKECFDCGACYPEYISINNGVFICNNCLEVHNKFPKEISSTLKNNLSSLNNKELQYMYLGGNQNLFEFINYEFPELSKFKKNILYQTKAMQYYRDKLNYLVNSGPEPIRPSKEINAYELIDVYNERNNKKYERINLDGNKNKGIYKTKRRNKSVGNRNVKDNKNLIYSNNTKKIRKNSINKSFRKNHFLDEDNVEEELKRHKSFYKEMNKLFKDEDETSQKEYSYYRKNKTNFISNDINNKNIKLNNMNFDKDLKYNPKTNINIKKNVSKFPVENIYNNNYYNLSTTKNIFMFTPLKDNLIYDYSQINNNDINALDKFYLTNKRDIYLKPKTSSLTTTIRNEQDSDLYLTSKSNINKINLANNNYRNDNSSLRNTNLNELQSDYYSSNTYNRKSNQNKTKELFANININKKGNVQNNNLMRYIRRNELKKEPKEDKKEKNNHTYLDNNKIQIKEIKIENIRRKRSTNIFNDEMHGNKNNNSNIINNYKNLNNQAYKKLSIKTINNNRINNNNKNYMETENNINRGKQIKNVNIFFDKNKINKYQNHFINISFNKPEENIGNSLNPKYSIRNKYKMKRKQDNII